MAGLTDKQVRLSLSMSGRAKAEDTSNNGDVIFDGYNKMIFTRGVAFDCKTRYNKIDSIYASGLKIANLTPFERTDSSTEIWIPRMTQSQFGIAKLGYTTSGDNKAVQIDEYGNLYIQQTHPSTNILVGDDNTNTNEATTNGNTYIKVKDDDDYRNSIKIIGTDAVGVSSDANGVITINAHDSDASICVGASETNANSATTNGNTFIKILDGTTFKNQIKIIGTDDIGVTSDANGVIKVDGHNTISSLIVGGKDATSSGETANGGTYIKLFNDATLQSKYKIYGDDDVKVTTDSSGDIKISSHDTKTSIAVGTKGTHVSGISTNGNTHIKIIEDTLLDSEINIKGSDGTSVVSDVSGNITISSHDTQDSLVAGPTGTKDKGATTNGGTFIKLVSDSILNSEIKLLGSGDTTVSSDANGVITIYSEAPKYQNFVKSGATAEAGLVPAPPKTEGSTKYLREDGTWSVPPYEDTWLANSKDVSGYVKAGSGYANMVWKTDANGNPDWRADEGLEYEDFVKSGANAASGLVPQPPTTAGTTKFLREDGTWSVPAYIQDTWNANTRTQDGYVTAGEGYGNKVWKTDANGNPAWRNETKVSTVDGLSGGTISGNLYVNGTIKAIDFFETTDFSADGDIDVGGDGTIEGNLVVNGTVTAWAFYESSDENLKKNIEDIDDETNIPKLHSFNWKENNQKSYGFIAQEVEKCYPELVGLKEDGTKMVNYDAALSLTVGKLMKKIERLEKEIQELKSK